MTKANDKHRTKRLMKSVYDDFVVELGEGIIFIRPKGTRAAGPAAVMVAVGPLYQRLLLGRKSPKTRL